MKRVLWKINVLATVGLVLAGIMAGLVIRAHHRAEPRPITMTSRAVIAYREQYVLGQVTLVDRDYFKWTMETVETRAVYARHDTVAFVER